MKINCKKIALTLTLTASISTFVSGCSSQVTEQDISEPSQREVTTLAATEDSSNIKPVSKIEGRRKEFIDQLDSIQQELDALPMKEHSDAGVTNAMRSFYGISYESYDEALNEIYALLKNELSEDTMKDLQTEQISWIKHKESLANKEASQYKGGTFEFVAFNFSLYESTKKRCYELVNLYMTD